MKHFIIAISFFAIALSASCQSKSGIKKAYAFIEISNPGTIMMDDNGNPVKPNMIIHRFIYIENKGNTKPDIESVQYKNEILTVLVLPVNSSPEEAGKKKMNGEKILLNPAKGNTLWKLELQPLDPKKKINSASSVNKIIINEIKDRKHLKFIMDRDTELQGPMYG